MITVDADMWKRNKDSLTKFHDHNKYKLPNQNIDPYVLDIPEGLSYLGRATTVKGELSANKRVIINGSFEGQIVAPDHGIAIGAHANVKADVLANTVTVLGALKGNLTVGERTEICGNALVEGQIVSTKIVLSEGAHFKGLMDTKQAAVTVARYRLKMSKADLSSVEQQTHRTETQKQTK